MIEASISGIDGIRLFTNDSALGARYDGSAVGQCRLQFRETDARRTGAPGHWRGKRPSDPVRGSRTHHNNGSDGHLRRLARLEIEGIHRSPFELAGHELSLVDTEHPADSHTWLAQVQVAEHRTDLGD